MSEQLRRVYLDTEPTRLPDAIHIATAQRAGCRYFVSGERRLKFPDGMSGLELGTFTIDDIMMGRP